MFRNKAGFPPRLERRGFQTAKEVIKMYYDKELKRYVLYADNEIDAKVGKIYHRIYLDLRLFLKNREIDEETFERIFRQFLDLLRVIDLEKAEDILSQIEYLAKHYGTKAVETAISRELHLRVRALREGGRPSVVKKYKYEIDSIYKGYRDNPLLSKRENIEKRIIAIKMLLNEVKEKHSRATYFKIKKYAVEKISELRRMLKMSYK